MVEPSQPRLKVMLTRLGSMVISVQIKGRVKLVRAKGGSKFICADSWAKLELVNCQSDSGRVDCQTG